jgi:nitrogen fixation NifU-like protein
MTTDSDDVLERAISRMRGIYTNVVIDHAINTRNFGHMPDYDGMGKATSSCGETIHMWLKVKDGKVEKASFETDGCAATLACGSMATEMAIGKDVLDAQKIKQKDILEALEGLPNHNQELATVASRAIKNAVSDYLVIKRDPWKKTYRKM